MMKSRCTFLFILSFVIVSLLYRADFIVAMAAPQNVEETSDSAAEQSDESAADREPEECDRPADAEAEESGKPDADTEAEESGKPDADEEAEESGNTDADAETEEGGDPDADAEAEESGKPDADAEAEEGTELSGEPKQEEGANPDADMEAVEPGESTVEAVLQASEYADKKEPEESVSTGRELTDWLESHKFTGGTVKLADHILLEEAYDFYPNAPYMPAITVDTDRYTITVTGKVGLSSDNRLAFSGHPDGKGIFHVKEKGFLSMQGIAVESETGALWQEEGAGLVVSGCQITGSIHYAKTPFVIDPDPVCVVVEKGQTVNDVLPESLRCRVNRQGEVSSDDSVPLVWNLEGTKRQQEERLRFQAQGFFLQAVSVEPVRCTVVYNDYPMTFKEVRASMYKNSYIFKGFYSKPEGESLYTLKSEYSFDAENWFVSDEKMVDDTSYADFVIVADDVQSDRAAYPHIYIRLRCDNNETEYFSNMLCYAADNLDEEEDIGGSRGGGTSITNPPDEPREEIDGTPSEGEKPEEKADRDEDSDKADPEEEAAGRTENATPADAGGADDGAGQPLHGAQTDEDARRQSGAESSNIKADRISATKAETAKIEQTSQAASMESGEASVLYVRTDAGDGESAAHSDLAVPDHVEAVEAISAYGENGVDFTQTQSLRADNRRAGHMVIAAGAVLLAAFAGTAGFYTCTRYFRSGTNR